MTRAKTVVVTLGAAIVVLAAAVVVWNAAATSSARVADTTSTDSFFAAGEVRLEQVGAQADFIFDDDGLHPGRVVSGCVDLVYDGNVAASVRLHGEPGEERALDDYLELDIFVTASCEEAPESDPFFTGPLSSLWTRHPSFGQGIEVLPAAEQGDRVAIWADIELVDDNRAQGLTSSFALTAEARP